MASPGNRHCVNYIGTLSIVPIKTRLVLALASTPPGMPGTHPPNILVGGDVNGNIPPNIIMYFRI